MASLGAYSWRWCPSQYLYHCEVKLNKQRGPAKARRASHKGNVAKRHHAHATGPHHASLPAHQLRGLLRGGCFGDYHTQERQPALHHPHSLQGFRCHDAHGLPDVSDDLVCDPDASDVRKEEQVRNHHHCSRGSRGPRGGILINASAVLD